MPRTSRTSAPDRVSTPAKAGLRKPLRLLVVLALALGCAGAGLTGCAGTNNASGSGDATQQTAQSAETSAASSESIEQQLLAIDGVTSVKKYTNDFVAQLQLDQTYQIYELTFTQPVDHNDPSAGTFGQHVRLYYTSAEAVSVVNTDGYMLTDLPSTAYSQFINQTFLERYGMPNIVQVEYRFFGESTPEGLDPDSTELWGYLTMEQAATDFHEIVQKLSGVLTGKRIWTGTSKGGLTTDYQCYFQEQHGYNDADVFMGFCAPFCETRNDTRFMDAVFGEIGYKAYGEEKASQWHELLDKFQVACIKYRDQLQTRFYQDCVSKGYKFRESHYGSDESTQAARLWDVAIIDFTVGFWQYHQNNVVDQITQAVDADNPEKIYECISAVVEPSFYAYNAGFFPYPIQAATEMGDCEESFDHLRQIVAEAREAAPEDEKASYYVATETNCSDAELFLTDEQLEVLPYSDSTRNAMIEWFNSTTTAHLIMVSGQTDPWYFVRPELTFSNSQIKCYESTYNHVTTIADLSEADQASLWETLDGWLGTASSQK